MSDLKTLKTRVSPEVHEKFNKKCEQLFGNKRSADKVIRKLAIKFNNGEINLD